MMRSEINRHLIQMTFLIGKGTANDTGRIRLSRQSKNKKRPRKVKQKTTRVSGNGGVL
jgi:hypothetical protein